MEQKKLLKSGLNIAHFKQYVSIIEKETKEYFQSWGESGERSKIITSILFFSLSVYVQNKVRHELLRIQGRGVWKTVEL